MHRHLMHKQKQFGPKQETLNGIAQIHFIKMNKKITEFSAAASNLNIYELCACAHTVPPSNDNVLQANR